MIIYSERAPQSDFIRFILIGSTVLILALVISAWTQSHESQWVLLFVFIVLVWATSSFLTVQFAVTEEGVTAMFWPFQTSIPFQEIENVGVTEEDVPFYVGYGLRVFGRKLFYATRKQLGVVMKKRSGFFTHVVLTTQHPEQFAKLVERRKKQAPAQI